MNLFEFTSVREVMDGMRSYLAGCLNVVEVELFTIDTDNNFVAISGDSSDILMQAATDIDERGILEFSMGRNEISVLPYFSNIRSKTLLIIPIVNTNEAFFIANSINSEKDFNKEIFGQVLSVCRDAFFYIQLLNDSVRLSDVNRKYESLTQQVLASSSQIAASEIVRVISTGYDVLLREMKTNLDLLERNVGDSNHRIDIISQRISAINNINQKIVKYSNIQYTSGKYGVRGIIDDLSDILSIYLQKNGIVAKFNVYDDAEITCYYNQLVFALMSVALYTLSYMDEGGNIEISAVRSNDLKFITITIADTGLGVNDARLNGDLISELALSEERRRDYFLFMLGRQIISQHNGSFSIYNELRRGTTYKITFEVIK